MTASTCVGRTHRLSPWFRPGINENENLCDGRDNMNTDTNSPELDKGSENHVFRSDWVSTGLVPR